MLGTRRHAADITKAFFRAKLRFLLTIIIVLSSQVVLAQSGPVLTSAVIRGSSVYSPGELFDFYRDHLGKRIELSQVQAIATAIADSYTQDGFARPRFHVHEDLVPLGVLRIDILERRISTVNITGNPGPYRARLENMGAELKSSDTIRGDELQATLQRMRALPGLELSASTRQDPSEATLYSLDLDARFQPVAGIVRMTNRGTDEVGPNYLLGQFMGNGLLGGRTSLGVNFGAATDYDEYRGIGVLANQWLGDNGTLASVYAFRSFSNPQERPADRDDEFFRERVVLGFTKPLPGTAGAVSFTGELDLADLSIFRADNELRDERLRMLDLSLRRTWGTALVRYAGELQLVKGLGGLNSGLDAQDLLEDARREDFTLFRLSLTRVALLTDRWSWRFDGFAQQTAYVLPYSQRFKIGGERLGRGFEIAEIAGDQGLGAKLELRRRLRVWPASRGYLSAFGFYDIGAAWKQDLEGRESAATAGIGLRVEALRMIASLEIAKPLTHPDVEGRRDASLFLEFNYRL